MSALGYAVATMLISGLVFHQACKLLRPWPHDQPAVGWVIIIAGSIWWVSTIAAIILGAARL